MKYFVLVVVFSVCLVRQASSQSIGVFADSAGTSCALEVLSPGDTITAYIVAHLGGFNVALGARFHVVGLPDGWLTVSTPHSSSTVVVGDPFGEGTAIAFPNCTTESPLVLFDVLIVSNALPEQVPLTVVSVPFPECPSPPHHCDCVFVLGCDAVPCDCLCMDGVRSWINGPDECTVVTVADQAWSTLKLLFR